jgi:hypothetical protein
MKRKGFLSVLVLLILMMVAIAHEPAGAETTNCTPITSLPYIINTQGVYCFTGHLATTLATGNIITINTNNVILDLNGFKLGGQGAGLGTQAVGIYAYQRQNITIRNGTVRGFLKAIVLSDISPFTTSQGHLIEDIRADMNTYEGMEVSGRGVVVRNNHVVDTGGSTAGYVNAYGIVVQGPGAKVMGNNVFETVESGSGASSIGVRVYSGTGSVVEENRIGNEMIGSGTSTGVEVNSSPDVVVVNNRIAKVTTGVNFVGGSTGSYRDNILRGVTTPYIGGTEIARGTITGVTAGAGLTGGGAGPGVTLDVGAGAGITVGVDTVSVSFGGSGSATTVARSDHGHSAADISSGTLSTDRFSAYADLVAEGHLNDHDHFSQFWSGSNSSMGLSITNTGTGDGIRAYSNSPATNFAGVYAANTSTGSGVCGESTGGYGVYGRGATGVYGTSSGGTGVSGNAAGGAAAVVGNNTSNGPGVYGISTSGYGVHGFSASGYAGVVGMYGAGGTAATGSGVYGSSNSTTGYGGYFVNSGGSGLNRAVAVAGFSGYGSPADNPSTEVNPAGLFSGVTGVVGVTKTNTAGIGGTGVYGYAPNADEPGVGVGGESYGTSGTGVRGWSHGTGLLAIGIHGYAPPTGMAGYFVNNVDVMGTLSKTAGSFKIDHPLDPENKYLYHSFVESPDMKNIYDGVAVLDGSGEAWVDLPEWFEALNKEFRYQLTCIGVFAQVYIAEKVSSNRFKIAGGTSGLEVSWQVTGIRKDAYAEAHRIPVEEAKKPQEQGYYIHPDLFGQPEEKGIEWVRRPELMKRMKAERERLKKSKSE